MCSYLASHHVCRPPTISGAVNFRLLGISINLKSYDNHSYRGGKPISLDMVLDIIGLHIGRWRTLALRCWGTSSNNYATSSSSVNQLQSANILLVDGYYWEEAQFSLTLAPLLFSLCRFTTGGGPIFRPWKVSTVSPTGSPSQSGDLLVPLLNSAASQCPRSGKPTFPPAHAALGGRRLCPAGLAFIQSESFSRGITALQLSLLLWMVSHSLSIRLLRSVGSVMDHRAHSWTAPPAMASTSTNMTPVERISNMWSPRSWCYSIEWDCPWNWADDQRRLREEVGEALAGEVMGAKGIRRELRRERPQATQPDSEEDWLRWRTEIYYVREDFVVR
ncbi:hypothetical protein C8R47DRAFT_1192416 [Mycena vitilis]|nr:hypothetical protein C8R47DRAFT_1192416 [Mycena vitilis]